jgi:hypothetical protein
MNIDYLEPLSRAWERMKSILWRPFDLATWVVLGFSAWLAGLADGAGGGGWKWILDEDDFPSRYHVGSMGDGFREASEALILLPIIFVVVMAVAALLLLILWVSSRAKFVFLDNVVHNRAEIVDPWNRFREIGNSLFLWRVGFIVASGLVVIVLLFLFLAPAATFSFSDAFGGLSFAAIFFGVLLMIVFGILAAYVALFLEAFVIPIMYKFDLKATEAWRYFLPWLKARPWPFILYGLLILLLGFLFVVFFAMACALSCCILAIPYVGTVILLPIWVTYRLFSVEFLAQFDPGFDLFTPAIVPAEGD